MYGIKSLEGRSYQLVSLEEKARKETVDGTVHFSLYCYHSISGVGPVVGMCAEVGFINVDREDKKVSFTPEGLQFVMLPNPQLDSQEDSLILHRPKKRSF